MIVIDTAHGHSKNVLKTLNKIKKFSKKLQFVLEILQQVMLQTYFIIQVQIY